MNQIELSNSSVLPHQIKLISAILSTSHDSTIQQMSTNIEHNLSTANHRESNILQASPEQNEIQNYSDSQNKSDEFSNEVAFLPGETKRTTTTAIPNISRLKFLNRNSINDDVQLVDLSPVNWSRVLLAEPINDSHFREPLNSTGSMLLNAMTPNSDDVHRLMNLNFKTVLALVSFIFGLIVAMSFIVIWRHRRSRILNNKDNNSYANDDNDNGDDDDDKKSSEGCNRHIRNKQYSISGCIKRGFLEFLIFQWP